jgi:SNF2 family DNA or RNA helicase
VLDVWPDQLQQWSTRTWRVWSGEVMGARGVLSNPSVARRAEALIQQNAYALRLGQPFMAVVNYEASHLGQMGELLKGTDWDAVILDESHRIKLASGKASKLAATICARARKRGGRVLALTGTPMPHSPLDLFAQVRALDGGARLGTSYHRFCHAYGAGEQIYTGGGVQRTVFKDLRPDRREAFLDLIRPIWHRVASADVLDLPETTDIHRTVEMSPKARTAYDALQRDLIAKIDGGVVTAANAMVLVTRLAQATSGFARNADTGETVAIDGTPPKATLLHDILQDLEEREPVVVFCRFHADLDAVRTVTERLGRRYGELSGRRRDALAGPRMSPDVDVAGVQLQSGGVGIDLTRSHHAIYYSVAFALADYLQSRARLHRQGQRHRVTYTHLLVRDSIDWAIYGALRKREQVVDTVIAHLNQKGTQP